METPDGLYRLLKVESYSYATGPNDCKPLFYILQVFLIQHSVSLDIKVSLNKCSRQKVNLISIATKKTPQVASAGSNQQVFTTKSKLISIATKNMPQVASADTRSTSDP